MERLKLTIEARSPLCLSERRPAGQFRGTLRYIPGSVIRGAAADLMIARGLKDTEEFRRLFLGEHPAVFSNAYAFPQVFPASGMSCKAGCAGSRSEPDESGTSLPDITDTLVQQLCFEALNPAGLLYMPRCRRCGSRLERHLSVVAPWVTGRLLTRVAMNRRRGTAEHEFLYTPLVINEAYPNDGGYQGTRFRSTVTVECGADILADVLKNLGHLGSGRSRGLGRVSVEVDREATDPDAARRELRSRWERLNEAIKKFWDLLRQAPGTTAPDHNPYDGRYFSIDFYSDAILKEDGWVPSIVLTADMLRERCGVCDGSLKLVRAYSGYEYRGGWNAAWGVPKDVDVVAPAGSVFVFWTKEPDLWELALLDLELWGVGERTAEGYGQVRVCDETHYRTESKGV